MLPQDETVACIRKQIRMRRFYAIEHECYEGAEYDTALIEECCDAVLGEEILNANKLIEMIALKKGPYRSFVRF